MAPGTGDIFRGVRYRIACSDDVDSLRMLLDTNGGAQESDLKRTTRIIVDSSHFAEVEKLECKGIMVTPEWVYSSVKAGAKKPAHYYSADPAMIFSSAVFSAVDLFAAITADILPTLIGKCGGQWLPTITDDVTHLIVDQQSSGVDRQGFKLTLVSLRWVAESVKTGKLLPIEASGVATQQANTSPARRFCAALLLEMHDAEAEITAAPGGPRPDLPLEILAKVFIMSRDLELESASRSISVLLTISHVCRRWRDIALYTTALWTHIVLNFHTEQHYARLHNLIQQWEIRSRPRPLSLTIRSCYPRKHNPVIDFISIHASRIRNLSLQLPAAHFHPFLQVNGGSFPLLESLNMTIIQKSDSIYDATSGLTRSEYFRYFDSSGDLDDGVLWEDLKVPISVLENLPRLRKLTIDCSSLVTLDPRTLPLTWGNLTDIDLNVSLSVLDVAYILPMCTSVERISIVADDSIGVSMPPITRMTLPLTTLDWQSLLVNDTSIFGQLILPNLTSMRMREGCTETLFLMHEQSGFALEDLSLTFYNLSLLRLAKDMIIIEYNRL
ncbi:hypothetical protein DFH06DRAFT_1418380 [Mycena polygramma]|nr:hypothetical protein DFH06DRAFT_1418380 [Mycena polygramma]